MASAADLVQVKHLLMARSNSLETQGVIHDCGVDVWCHLGVRELQSRIEGSAPQGSNSVLACAGVMTAAGPSDMAGGGVCCRCELADGSRLGHRMLLLTCLVGKRWIA